MSVAIEEEGSIDVVRYVGLHRCRKEDHERGKRVGEELARRIATGRSRVLLDVSRLMVAFISGRNDLFETWKSLFKPSVRLALLWDPATDRLRGDEALDWHWIRGLVWKVQKRIDAAWPDYSGVRVVGTTEEALRYLLSDEPDPPRA